MDRIQIRYGKTLFILTLVLCLIIAATSACGLAFEKELYAKNVPAYTVQIVGLDLGNLFVVVPVLLIMAFLMRRGSKRAFIIWFGTMMYGLYIFTYNCFTLHFNHLFLLYAFEMGLVLYSLFIAVAGSTEESIRNWFAPDTKTTAAIVFLVIAGLFFIGLWLSEIVPSTISGVLPESAAFSGLITAAFHALDLGVFFPAFLVSAVLLYRKNGFGYLFAPAFMAFTTVMCLCLVFLGIMLAWKGMSFSVTELFQYGGTAVLSAFFLVRFLRYCPAPGRK